MYNDFSIFAEGLILPPSIRMLESINQDIIINRQPGILHDIVVKIFVVFFVELVDD